MKVDVSILVVTSQSPYMGSARMACLASGSPEECDEGHDKILEVPGTGEAGEAGEAALPKSGKYEKPWRVLGEFPYLPLVFDGFSHSFWGPSQV